MQERDSDPTPQETTSADTALRAGTTPAPTGGSPRPTRRTVGTVGVGAVMGLAGMLFATSARTSAGGAIRDDVSTTADILRRREREIAALETEARRKRAQVDELTAQQGDSTASELQRYSEAVGLTEVHGPGLRISLSDAPEGVLGTLPDVGPDDLVVHQQDLESYINALWAGGAEAMMLQDQRVVAGSAFRCAGNTLLLEGRVYSPPFIVTAIGNTQSMRHALDDSHAVQVYRDWVAYVGLGETIEDLPDATLPGFDGSLTIDIAKAG